MNARAPSSPVKTWLRRAVGPAVLVLILASIDRDELFAALAGTKPALVALAVATALPAIALRTLRWRALLGDALAAPRLSHLFGAYTHAIFLGTVTPGRLGEFVKIGYLTRRGVDAGTAFTNVLVDRLFDVAMLLLCAGLGIWWWALPADLRALPALLAALGVAAVLAVVGLLGLRALARGGDGTRPLGGALGRVAAFAEQALGALTRVSPARFAASLALSTVAWAVNFVATWLLAEALGLGLDYFTIAGLSAAASLVTLVPITMLGAGTRDAALIVLLARFGVGESQAVALSTLFLGQTLAVGLLSGVLGLLRDRAVETETPDAAVR